MTHVDLAIVGVVLLSVLIGAWRGFVRELLGLGAWVLAIAMSWWLSVPAAQWLQPYIDAPSIRVAVAGAVLFVLGMIIGGLITALGSRVVRDSWFSGPDHTLGGVLGVLRGLILILALVWVLHRTPAVDNTWWHQSVLIPPLEELALLAEHLLPQAWRESISAIDGASPPSFENL